MKLAGASERVKERASRPGNAQRVSSRNIPSQLTGLAFTEPETAVDSIWTKVWPDFDALYETQERPSQKLEYESRVGA